MAAMSFQEVLKEMLEQENDPLTNYFPQGIAMAKQIEANRLALEELRATIEAHWPAWKNPSDA